jgi:hypothetical protein
MRLPLKYLLTGLALLLPATAWAQQGAPSSAPVFQVQPPSPPPAQNRPNPTAGVPAASFDRVKRALRQLPPSSVKTALRVEYYVEVAGVAPPISIFEPGDLSGGRVPYAAPTYADLRQVLTPAEFRAPVVSISSLARGGTKSVLDRSSQRARARRVEDARRKAMEAERERQQKLKESVVVAPPK